MKSRSRAKRAKTPWDQANIVSKFFMFFIWPLLWRGKKHMALEDLQEPPDGVRAKLLTRRLEKNYNIELTSGRTPSFLRAILKTFGPELALVGVLDLIAKAFWQPLQIVSLGWLIKDTSNYVKSTNEPLVGPISDPTTSNLPINLNVTQNTLPLVPFMSSNEIYSQIIMHTVVLLLSTWMNNLFTNPYILQAYICGMKCRIATTGLVYQKALRLNQASLNEATTGRMTNMLSNDISRFEQFTSCVLNLISAPIQAIVIVVLLDVLYVGFLPTVACLSSILLFIIIQTSMGRGFGKFRLLTARRTDERIRIINELIVGIRIIKMYAWEEPFKLLVEKARRREINMIAVTSTLRALNSTLFFVSNKITVFAALITYITLGNEVDAEIVFVTISLCTVIRIPLMLFFPIAIAATAETIVSCKRINRFLCLAEHEFSSSRYLQTNDKFGYKYALTFEKVSATWTGLEENHADAEVGAVFKEVTFRLNPGELLLVVGRVASGKSSLLMTILGELPITSGYLQVIGRLSFCPQEPWIFPGTVRDNILFGRPYKAARYNEVIKACSLARDVEILPYGDKTLVGERGVSLSGGQKARVNLARSLYHEADIYLLDDPLSAVDAPVARDIFRDAVQGFLKGKSVVLATHQLQFLRQATRLLLLDRNFKANFGTVDQVYQSETFKELGFAESAFADANQHPESSGQSRSKSNGSIETDLSATSERTHSLSIKSKCLERRRRLTSGPTDSGSFEGSFTSSNETNLDNGSAKTGLDDGRQTGSETMPTLSGNWSAYKYYISCGSNIFGLIWFAFINFAGQTSFQYTDVFLSYWTDAAQRRSIEKLDFKPIRYTDNLEQRDLIIIFSVLVALSFFSNLLRALSLYIGSMISSITIHKRFFASIVNAPVKFFDFNPIGILLNRLGRDMGIIDETLPQTYYDVFATMVNIFGTMILTVFIDPWNAIASVILLVMALWVRHRLSKTIIRLKRLEGIRGGPVFTNLSVTLNGLTTIRAFKSNTQFLQKCDNLLDKMSSVSFLYYVTARLLSFMVDMLSLLFVTAIVITSVIISLDSNSPSSIGLIISQIIFLPGPMQWGMRQMVEVESQMTCVQRVQEYSSIEPEEANEDREKLLMQSYQLFAPKSSRGNIRFVDVSLKYFVDEPYVLKNLSFNIIQGEKVGVVGRTGAGKSSIISIIFRLYPYEGSIEIDGFDTKMMSLRQLRSSISIIPQDPVLFAGTIRKNLDPFSDHTDMELWTALEAVQLKQYFESTSLKLEHLIKESGSNLSVGQRQLICLARAIIRRNNILVLDEATANVDPETDAFIQQTIQNQFQKCTVITIAHRLITIAESDRVLVLDQGELKEFDDPYNLLRNESSIFKQMVESTQTQQMERLKQAIEMSHKSRLPANN